MKFRRKKLHLLCSVINPLEDLAKAALANPLLLREHNLGIHFLHKKENISDRSGFPKVIHQSSCCQSWHHLKSQFPLVISVS